MPSNIDISVVIPIYNEEESLPQLVYEILDAMRPNYKKFEIVLINDGSTDKSADVLAKLAKDKKECNDKFFLWLNGDKEKDIPPGTSTDQIKRFSWSDTKQDCVFQRYAFEGSLYSSQEQVEAAKKNKLGVISDNKVDNNSLIINDSSNTSQNTTSIKNLQQRSLSFRFHIDKKDDPLFPKKGYLFDIYFKSTGIISG